MFLRRMLEITDNKHVFIELGLRRAQGPQASLQSAKQASRGGFSMVANTLCGFINRDIKISGTMSHSFIMSYQNTDLEDIALYKEEFNKGLEILDSLGVLA